MPDRIVVMAEIENRYGTPYMVVRPMRVEEGAEHPLNISHGGFSPFENTMADLELSGHFTTSDGALIAFEPHYIDAHCVDWRRAKGMLDTLRKINRAIVKAEAREHGDVYMAFAHAIGAGQAIIRGGENRGGSLADYQWRFVMLEAGRNELRHKIAATSEKTNIGRVA